MIILRSLIFNLGMWLTIPPYTLLALLVMGLPAPKRSYLVAGWARWIVRWLAWICNLHYRVIGAEHIPQQPCVILSKHQSAWETIAFQVIFPPQIWVLKRELLWIPFFGWALWAVSSIAINRSAGREALRQLGMQGKDRLARGLSIVIFPEGTRMAPGQRGKYHMGGAWLAHHARAIVVPVAHNAGAFWGKKSWLKYPGTITVVVGKPIMASTLSVDELHRQIEDWIETQQQHLA